MDNGDPLLLQRPSVNPYFSAAGLVRDRLRWDLNIESWRSRERLKRLKDKFKGEKAVILCNGPSLNKVDFDLLNGKCYTFGLNKVNLLFSRTSFRPSCVVAVNSLVLEQNAEFYNSTDLPLFLDSVAFVKKWVKAGDNKCFLHSTSFQKFARDCSISINQGFTVTYVAMQLAFHLGFRDVALVGCDHSFATKGPANKTVESGKEDLSHFDPTYFSGGVKWQLPDIFESEISYGRAKRVYEAYNRKIVNCTEGGYLEVFDRVGLESFLSSK